MEAAPEDHHTLTDGSDCNRPTERESAEGLVTGTSSYSLDITARGRPLIIFKGYEHRQVRIDQTRNLKAYRCIKKKCKGRLHTDYDDTNVRIVSEHVHEPNFDAEFKRRRRTLLRELAQKGNVSPSQIIQKARDLEMQYHDVCETTKTSYAAERRYIQRYWNRQKQNEFANKMMNLNGVMKMEQNGDGEDVEEESVNGSSFPNIPAQAAEQFSQFLQMTADGGTGGNSEPIAMNIFLNVLLQQMLSNVVGSSSFSNNFHATDGDHSPNSSYKEKLYSLATKHILASGNVVDATIQTTNDEASLRGPVDEAAVRDTLALELGTILAKNFWPAHYLREDKLKLMIDVIGKLTVDSANHAPR